MAMQRPVRIDDDVHDSGAGAPDARALALAAWRAVDTHDKCARVLAIVPQTPIDALQPFTPAQARPGRPARPTLVAPAALQARSVHTPEGRAALIHSLAHIELNAIDLACDICWRFAGMPEAFYRQWLQVAHEEATHFQLLLAHLRSMGFDYGDFPAHDGLWEMAGRTQDDLLARLVLVPRTLEARGLDASPPIRAKLVAAGDRRAGEILDIILRDEIGHVAVGNHWFRWLCAQRGLEPGAAEAELAQRHRAPRPRGPFNHAARRAAGFTEEELARLGA